MRIQFWLFRTLTLSLTACALPAVAQLNESESELDVTIAKISEWVQTEKTISEERTEWQIEKAALEDLIEIHRSELELLNEQIESAEEVASAADEQRATLLEQQDTLRKTANEVEKAIIAYEKQMKELLEYLPDFVRQEVMPLITRIPEDPENTNASLSQRMQNIVGILSHIDKFNNTVELKTGERTFDDGKLVQVKTLYFGLGVAYYVDGAAQHAGYLVPAPGEWTSVSADEIAPDVARLVRMYEGNEVDIQFIPVPVDLQ